MAAHLITVGVAGLEPWHAVRLQREQRRERCLECNRLIPGEGRRYSFRAGERPLYCAECAGRESS